MFRWDSRLPTAWHFLCAALLSSFLSTDLSADEPFDSELPNWRRYREGSLTADDFRGKAPQLRDPRNGGDEQLIAFTMTEVRYGIRFQVTRVGNRWTARLTSADAYAVVLRDQSWNLRPQDERLMDHEQGHFDLSQSFALAVQLYFDEQLKSRHSPIGNSDSSAGATRNLEDKLRAELKPIFDEQVKAQVEYDRVTHHGRVSDAQAEQRKVQLARIAELDEKLAALKKKSRK